MTAAGTTNVLPSMLLDASDPAAAWPTGLGLVLNANMIHISPWECCKGLVAGAGANLLVRSSARLTADQGAGGWVNIMGQRNLAWPKGANT